MRARPGDGKLTINGVAYSYRTIMRTGRLEPIDVSNSEGYPGNVNGITHPGFRATLPDLRGCEFEVSAAYFDDEDNPYAAPINLIEGGYYDVVWFPFGLTGVAADMGACLCVETSEQGTVGQGALIPRARFRSDTLYSAPGEAG